MRSTKLLKKGIKKLNRQYALPAAIAKVKGVSQREVIDEFLDWFDGKILALSLDEFKGLLLFLKLRRDVAISLLHFYQHEETRKLYSHLPINKQIQTGLRCFNQVIARWSRADKARFALGLNREKQSRFTHWRLPYFSVKPIPSIWFIHDVELNEALLCLRHTYFNTGRMWNLSIGSFEFKGCFFDSKFFEKIKNKNTVKSFTNGEWIIYMCLSGLSCDILSDGY